MYKIIFFSFFLSIAFNSSSQQPPSSQIDSTFSVFWDSKFKVRLQIFNTDEPDGERNNALISVISEEQGKQLILYRDSLFAYTIKLTLKDFNGDGIKDILVFNSMKGQYNPSYNLYLVNQKNNRLTRVKEFEKVWNPDYDKKNCAILSFASFEKKLIVSHYVINNSGKLLFVVGVE